MRFEPIGPEEAPVGVVLRRGPSDRVRLIKWNTADDTFESGQWFHGRIHERRCDLSPDGSLFVYFVKKFSRKTLADCPNVVEALGAWVTGNSERLDAHYTYAWTAVSKLPWLTALALWPKGDCWAGGGLFEANDVLCLNHSSGNGWRTEQEEIFGKPSPSGDHELIMVQTAVDFGAYGGQYVLEFRVRCAGFDPLVELGRGTHLVVERQWTSRSPSCHW